MKIFTPVKAIRAKCMDCCCNELKEIRECDILHCALWPYRMGRRPRGRRLHDLFWYDREVEKYLLAKDPGIYGKDNFLKTLEDKER